MKDKDPKENEKPDEQNDADKLDENLHELEMLYRSRVIDVPLSSNVKVVEIDKDDNEDTKEEE